MKTFFTTLKIKYLRKTISSEEYNIQRLNDMNGKVQYWILSQKHANTVAGRNFCSLMVNMYMKRYQYYINK